MDHRPGGAAAAAAAGLDRGWAGRLVPGGAAAAAAGQASFRSLQREKKQQSVTIHGGEGQTKATGCSASHFNLTSLEKGKEGISSNLKPSSSSSSSRSFERSQSDLIRDKLNTKTTLSTFSSFKASLTLDYDRSITRSSRSSQDRASTPLLVRSQPASQPASSQPASRSYPMIKPPPKRA